jgi:hypothetical protein
VAFGVWESSLDLYQEKHTFSTRLWVAVVQIEHVRNGCHLKNIDCRNLVPESFTIHICRQTIRLKVFQLKKNSSFFKIYQPVHIWLIFNITSYVDAQKTVTNFI